MNKINDEPMDQLPASATLSNVTEDSTKQFNTLGYPISSSNWIYLICLQFKCRMLTDVLSKLLINQGKSKILLWK